MVKMIKSHNVDGFEKLINDFITQDNIKVKNIQYSTEIESSRITYSSSVGSGTDNRSVVHFAMIEYEEKKGDKVYG